MTKRFYGIMALAVLGIVSAIVIDIPLAQAMPTLHGTVWYDIADMLGVIGRSWWWLVSTAVGAAIFWSRRRAFSYQLLTVFAAISISGIAANILKVLICRPRPMSMLESGQVWPNLFGFCIDFAWNSFPSGHATTGLSLAIVGSSCWPRYAWVFWLLGIAIAVSRIVLNVHYLSDVLAGSLLGIIVSWWCLQKLETRSNIV